MPGLLRGLNIDLRRHALLVGWALLTVLLSLEVDAKTLRLGNGGEPETLDPHRYNLRLEETILSDLFLGLTTSGIDGKPVPGSAERWTVSEDGKVWTFYLRPGLTWSDGKTLTAADFVFSLRRTLDPKTAASLAYFLYPIDGAEAVNQGKAPLNSLGVRVIDTNTLEIKLTHPNPYFAERLMYPTGFPVPAHVIAAKGEQWTKAENLVTNGAFTLAEWVPQGQVRLKKNPRFYDAANVQIDEVIYFPTDDELTAFNRYRAGDLHAIGGFPSGQLKWAQVSAADQLHLSPLLSIMYLVFNMTQSPFTDVRVREALALALDRDVLTERVMRTGDLPAFSFVPSMVEDYSPTTVTHARSSRADRLTRARTLLSAAGYSSTNPLRVQLRYISGNDNKKVHVAIAAMWKEIDVVTELFHAELKVHFAELRQGEFQVAQAGWFGENNPGHYLGLLESDTGNVNYGRYRNGTYDSLMASAERTASLPARTEFYRRAEALAMRELPVIPLYSVMIRSLVSPRISGWQDNPRNVHNVRYLRLAE